jgi:hypothetical protein
MFKNLGLRLYPLYCTPQSTQSAGPVRFLIFCSISIPLLASLVAGRRPQCSAGAVQQGMYSTIPIHWNIKSAPASSGRSRVGPAFYVFSFLAVHCSSVHPHSSRRKQAHVALSFANFASVRIFRVISLSQAHVRRSLLR